MPGDPLTPWGQEPLAGPNDATTTRACWRHQPTYHKHVRNGVTVTVSILLILGLFSARCRAHGRARAWRAQPRSSMRAQYWRCPSTAPTPMHHPHAPPTVTATIRYSCYFYNQKNSPSWILIRNSYVMDYPINKILLTVFKCLYFNCLKSKR